MLRVCLNLYGALVFALLISGCISDESISSENALFRLLPSSETNITFQNEIIEDDSLNLLTYEYIYNGGGVGIIDVNTDSLPDIFFSGSKTPSQLYLNKGQMKFENITSPSGINTVNQWSTGTSIIDINNDGLDDIYVCIGGPGNKSTYPNRLYVNQGDLTFKEAATEYGIDDPGESIQAVFFDYDLDGDLDMYLLTGGGFEKSPISHRPIQDNGESRNNDRLYQNNYDSLSGHPVFTNVSREAGILIEGFGLGVSVLDANQDGWPDVYVANDYLSRDLLYINNQDGTFTDQSLNYFKHTSYFSMGCDAGDINNDGLLDIVTMDMLPEDRTRRKLMFEPNQYDRFHMAVNQDYGHQYMRNMLQLNRGNNSYSEIGQLAGINRTDWSWAPLLADFDNDGFLDLHVTNGFGKDVTDLDFVKFRRAAASQYSKKEEVERAVYEEFKKQPAISLPNYIFQNKGDLTFSNQSQNWGITHPSISNGAAYADLDVDGDLDIIVNNINQEAFLYENTAVQKNPDEANFLKVTLNGQETNPSGIGATVYAYVNGESLVRYHQVARGFQSSVENCIHFGVGHSSHLDSILVKWPDGKISKCYDISVNNNLTLSHSESESYDIEIKDKKKSGEKSFFTATKSLEHFHEDRLFNDFNNQRLLLHGFSNQGPGIAVGDVNSDGLEDVFIGGSYGYEGELYLQYPDGHFDKKLISDKGYEDLGAIFFDADGDEDLDLYVASGGSERYAGHELYQDRLYINDGKGNFHIDKNALPPLLSSTSIVTAGDFDQDGDLDLFVGGRVIPGEFPKAPASYILKNDNGSFTDITNQVSSGLQNIGMVTTALWTDFDNDNRLDLVLAGEFMPLTFLKNTGDELVNITESSGLQNSPGMWNSLVSGDFDNDGDMDYVAGNLGINHSFYDVQEKPLKVHYADFDNNGSVDPIFSIYEEGNYYPLASLDQLTGQLPMLKKYVLHYQDFVKTTTSDLLGMLGEKEHETLTCQYLKSAFIENVGNGQFKIKPLPVETQFAPINGILSEDIDLDGRLDIIAVGNMYNTEVVNGRYDASAGDVLLNLGNNSFSPIPTTNTRFLVKGDAKAMARLELANNESLILVTRNDDELKSFTIERYKGLDRISPSQTEMSAVVTLSNGLRRKVEFSIGGSYMSQSSKQIIVTPMVNRIEFFDSKGEMTRKIAFDDVKAN